MKRTDFHYELPPELIAQRPLAKRSASRLLVLDGDSGAVQHQHFPQLLDHLGPDDLLVFNDTRVIPARLWGRKETGGKVEILLERMTGVYTGDAHIRSSKSPKPGTTLHLSREAGGEDTGVTLTVTDRNGDLFCLSSECNAEDAGQVTPLGDILSDIGHMPLPPYIERADELADRDRYQTVYAAKDGAVAAPTAGLHFTEELLQKVDAIGIRRTTVTLHVGAGTFQPVREDEIEDHVMHAEYVEVDEAVAEAVRQTRARGGRVVAVGTTAVRSLETSAQATGEVAPYRGDTDIFIFPGYRFKAVDAMVTNFHLPESTLLMLVSAFAGKDPIMAAYSEAVAEGYRFFSYGDAMFLTAAAGSRRSA